MKWITIIIIGACIIMMSETVLAAYPSGWNKCKNLTVNNPTGSTLTDFLINLNISSDADMQADFDDLRFYNGSCGTNTIILTAELESKTDSTNAYVWIKNNLTTGNNTIGMYYGNSTVSSYWNTTGGVSDSYSTGMYHLTDATDSSSKQYDGSASGAVASDGLWGGSYYFDGINDYISVTSPMYFLNNTNFTVESWVKLNVPNETTHRIVDWDDKAGSPNGGFWTEITSAGRSQTVLVNPAGTEDGEQCSAAITVVNDTWTLLTWVFVNVDGSYPLVYYYNNGVYVENDNFDAEAYYYISAPDATTNAYIGANEGAVAYLQGYVDELRISNTVRSNDWINLSYQLITNHASFVTYGTEENATVDDTANPVYSLNSTNSTTAGSNIEHRLKWTDNTELAGYIFSFCNGTWNGSDCPVGSADWDNTSYDKRKTVNLTNVAGETLINFPYFINVTKDSDMNADFSDIIFYENGTLLSFELENYTSAYAIFWVKIPSFTVTGTQLMMYYKNNTVVSSLSNGSSVWSVYGSVYHLNEILAKDGAGGSGNGTTTGTVTVQPGIIGNAVNFTSTSRINLGVAEAINLSNLDAFTIEYWVNSIANGSAHVVFAQSQGSCSWNIALGTYALDVANQNIKLTWRDDSGTTRKTVDSGLPEVTGVWQYVVATYRNATGADNATIYINGAYKSNNSNTLNLRPGPITTTQIGYGCDYGTFVGALDEFRISKNTMSAGWVNQSYQMVVQSTLTIFGAEESYSVPGGWVNDSYVAFSGLSNWSNVTKSVSSTVGGVVAWCVYANDTSGNMNSSSCTTPFTYTLTSGTSDTCTYSGSGNWLIKASDNCNITSNVDVHGDIYVNDTGNLNIVALISFDDGKKFIIGSGIKIILDVLSGGGIR